MENESRPIGNSKRKLGTILAIAPYTATFIGYAEMGILLVGALQARVSVCDNAQIHHCPFLSTNFLVLFFSI